jgi:hypothetical protein
MSGTVWVLHVSHKHGDNLSVFTSQERARRAIEAWAADNWEQETGEPLPDLTGEDLVEAYFEKVSDRESYRIEEATIDQF